MDHSDGWYCSCCGNWNYHYESYCYRCGSPRNYSYHSFFSHTSTRSHPHVNTEEYKRNSSEKSDSDNLSKSSKAELVKLKKMLELQIQLVDKMGNTKNLRVEIKNTLSKVKGKIPTNYYDRTKDLLNKLIEVLPNDKNKKTDLDGIKSLQQLARIDGQVSEDKELCEIIDLLTGTAILQTIEVEKSEEPKSEEKKEKKDEKQKSKDDNIPSDPQSLIEDISEQWKKGNFDSVQESLESLKKAEDLNKQVLKQNIPNLKKDLKNIIKEREEIINLINKIKSKKLKDEIKISEEKLTDDEILEELDEDDD